MPDVITCTSEGDNPSGRRRQGVNRPDDAPAGRLKGASLVPIQGAHRPRGDGWKNEARRRVSEVASLRHAGRRPGGRTLVLGNHYVSRVGEVDVEAGTRTGALSASSGCELPLVEFLQ